MDTSVNAGNQVVTVGADIVFDADPKVCSCFFFFSSRRRHTSLQGDWSSDVCSSDLRGLLDEAGWKLNSQTGIRELGGKPLSLTIVMLHHKEIGEYLVAQFRQIGVDLKVA